MYIFISLIYLAIALIIFILLSKYYFFSCIESEEIQAFILCSMLWIVFVPTGLVVLLFKFFGKCVSIFFTTIYRKVSGSSKIEK